ncbi:MAG: NAD(P)H-dependent glycerol-3-phosphate dehydrogenase [Pseudomonadota bacterium]
MIAILGAGAFGSALALAIESEIRLWGRGLQPGAKTAPRLLGYDLPDRISVVAAPDKALAGADLVLLAVPMAALDGMAAGLNADPDLPLIACSKGIEPGTGRGPSAVLNAHHAGPVGVLTGPSFASEIAAGRPTALTLAMEDVARAEAAQRLLSGKTLRIYRSDDVKGAELGGALKNVLAIAAGAVLGAGLGQSAQAALLNRGFSEIQALAAQEGARPETLAGLSGLGDLMLTAFSETSRNYRYGLALGRGERFSEDVTVEGVATAQAVAELGARRGLDLPVLSATHLLIAGDLTISEAVEALMSRPLREE